MVNGSVTMPANRMPASSSFGTAPRCEWSLRSTGPRCIE
jgi:hypothetical protein